MRYMTLSALGALLTLVMTTAASAAEEKPWWHFGMGQEEALEPAPSFTPSPTMTPATPDITPIEEESWFKWPSFPKRDETALPEQQAPVNTEAQTEKPHRPHLNPFGKQHYTDRRSTERPKNTWAQQPASTTTTDPAKSPWQSMSDGTKSAWHKTVDMVTPGDGANPPVVQSDPRVSWWDRMWGAEEEKNPETVTEWMAQDRLDP
jgi:hypothetical protein